MSDDVQAMLATAQRYHDAPILPPIRATIVAGNNDVGIRISDQGVCRVALCVTLSIIILQAEVFLFLKLKLRLIYSRSHTSETLRVWNTLALGRCEQ